MQEINNEAREVDFLVYRLEVDNITQALLNKFKAGVKVQRSSSIRFIHNPIYPEYLADPREHRQALGRGRADSAEHASGRDAHEDAHHVELRDERFVELRTELAARSRLLRFCSHEDGRVQRVCRPVQLDVEQHQQLRSARHHPAAGRDAGEPGVGSDCRVDVDAAGVESRRICGELRRLSRYVAVHDERRRERAGADGCGSTQHVLYTASLQAGATYYWKVVSKTNATVKNPSMIAESSTLSFTTSGSGGGGGGGTLSPFSGTPVALPGTVNAEKFDNGGEGVAYHDTTAGNTGGAVPADRRRYRGDADGGYDVGWIAAGEWLNYTVNVATAGTYTVQLRVASPSGAHAACRLQQHEQRLAGRRVPQPAAGRTGRPCPCTVTLGAGTQQMTLTVRYRRHELPHRRTSSSSAVAVDARGGGGGGGGIVAVHRDAGCDSRHDPRRAVRQRRRGRRVSRHDGRQHRRQFRATDVDIEAASEGGYDVGWIAAGEWLNYTMNVTAAGNYTVQLRVRVARRGDAPCRVQRREPGSVEERVGPRDRRLADLDHRQVPVTLGAGTQQMTIYFDTGGMNFHHATVQ